MMPLLISHLFCVLFWLHFPCLYFGIHFLPVIELFIAHISLLSLTCLLAIKIFTIFAHLCLVFVQSIHYILFPILIVKLRLAGLCE